MAKAPSTSPSSVPSLSHLTYIARRAGLSLILTGCASASAPTSTAMPETGNPSMSLEGTRWSASASTQRARMISLQIAPTITLPPSSASPAAPIAQVKPIVHVEATSVLASPNMGINNNRTSPLQDESSIDYGRIEDGDGGNLHIGRLLEATSIKEHQLIFLAGMRKKLGAVATCMEKVDKRRDSGNQFEPDEVTCFMVYNDACLKEAETPEGKSACVREYNSNVQYMSTTAEKALSQPSK